MKKSTKYLKILCNFIAMLIILFCVFYILPRAVVYFMPFVVGFVIALIANPVIRFLEKRIKIKRKYGFVLMIILVIAAIVLLCDGVLSLLWQGLQSFSAYLPTMYKNAGEEISNAANSLEKMLNGLPFVQDLDFDKYETVAKDFLGSLVSDSGGNTADTLGSVAKSIPNIFISVIMGLLATYFFIVDREKLACLVKIHVSQAFQDKCKMMYDQIVDAVGGYFKAQFQIMFVIYVILVVGLMILGVDYAWLIGFGIAFLDMLPVFGTGTVLCPWAVIKFFAGDYMMALGMVALYGICLVVHQVLQPKLVGDSVGMDPFATLFFMYIGYRVSSVLGMIIAIPVGMILINLYKAGAFDTMVWCVKEVVNDFNEFRKVK